MQWLQLSPLCLSDDAQLRKAVLVALVVSEQSSAGGNALMTLHRRVLEPTTFLVGEPDNLSILDVCSALERTGITSAAELLDSTALARIRNDLSEVAKERNRISPKVQMTCPDKINFMPARFVMDNLMLQEMAHVEEGVVSKRPFPKGLDVFAALGSKPALDLLLAFHKETENWDGFTPSMDRLRAHYAAFSDWDASVYNKWMQGLMRMLEEKAAYPYFMRLDAWEKKNLNTALASWAELKHDAILYAEQPFAVECGDGRNCAPRRNPTRLAMSNRMWVTGSMRSSFLILPTTCSRETTSSQRSFGTSRMNSENWRSSCST